MLNDKQIQFIEKLRNEGRLKPSVVVQLARNPRNPLHDMFEWDDKKAAHHHRLWQARQIIKRVNVYIEDPEERVVHVPCDEGSRLEGVYKSLREVVENDGDMELALTSAIRRLRAARAEVSTLLAAIGQHSRRTKRYKVLKHAMELVSQAESLVEDIA